MSASANPFSGLTDERLLIGDCRQYLPALAGEGVRVQTCITSPPYFGLRDYGEISCFWADNPDAQAPVAEHLAFLNADMVTAHPPVKLFNGNISL